MNNADYIEHHIKYKTDCYIRIITFRQIMYSRSCLKLGSTRSVQLRCTFSLTGNRTDHTVSVSFQSVFTSVMLCHQLSYSVPGDRRLCILTAAVYV